MQNNLKLILFLIIYIALFSTSFDKIAIYSNFDAKKNPARATVYAFNDDSNFME